MLKALTAAEAAVRAQAALKAFWLCGEVEPTPTGLLIKVYRTDFGEYLPETNSPKRRLSHYKIDGDQRFPVFQALTMLKTLNPALSIKIIWPDGDEEEISRTI